MLKKTLKNLQEYSKEKISGNCEVFIKHWLKGL